MSKLDILRKSTLYIKRLKEITDEPSFGGDHKNCTVLGSDSENRKMINETSTQKRKLKVVDISESERKFITKRNERQKSISSDDMMEDPILCESHSDTGEDDFLENSFEDSNTSEELMHVDTFMRT